MSWCWIMMTKHMWAYDVWMPSINISGLVCDILLGPLYIITKLRTWFKMKGFSCTSYNKTLKNLRDRNKFDSIRISVEQVELFASAYGYTITNTIWKDTSTMLDSFYAQNLLIILNWARSRMIESLWKKLE